MKSHQILEQLLEQGRSDKSIPVSVLNFYLAQGSFEVREKINTLIVRHSRAVSEMPTDSRFRFMSAHLRDCTREPGRFDIPERIREYLFEIMNFDVVGIGRQKLLQDLLSLVETAIIAFPFVVDIIV